MTDELRTLEQGNPIDSADLKEVVALDQSLLCDMLEADAGPIGGRPARAMGRYWFSGAVAAAAAAALVVGLLVLGNEIILSERDLVAASDPVEAAPDTDLAASPSDNATTDEQPTPPTITGEGSSGDSNRGDSDRGDSDGGDSDSGVEGQPNDTASEATATEDPSAGGTATSVRTPAPDPTTAPEPSATDDPPPLVSSGPFDPAIDLLVFHYDFAHLDDAHAAAAGRELASASGLEPHVVAGTQTPEAAPQTNEYRNVMQAVWGTSWVDAGTGQSERAAAVEASATRWLATIDAGGRVWVAEGGVSDHTADVVRALQRKRPALSLPERVFVVQHNARNERMTRPGDLAFVQSATTYERIQDGNDANATADLAQGGEIFEAAALGGPNAAMWAEVFAYLPAAELDFSDTVTALHVLGIGLEQVANPDDFATRFMG